MQKWEYLIFEIYGQGYVLNGELHSSDYDRAPTKSDLFRPSKFQHKMFSEFGAQGWELMWVSGDSYIFKRPKEK